MNIIYIQNFKKMEWSYLNPLLNSAIIILLIMFSSFFSSAETAYSSVNKIRLKSYADSGNKKAKRAYRISENYDKALSTILVGNNVVNIASSALATILFVSFFGEANGTLISTVGLTIIILIFGEVLPKNIAKENSERVAMSSSAVLYFLMIILTPFTFLLLKLNSFAKKLSGKRSDNKEPSVTEDELKYIVESIEDEGVLEEQESELVQSALEFDEKTAYDILTPRVDVTAIDIDDDPEKIKTTILKERYSRIPVYKDNIDNIIGILHTRDYLELLLEVSEPDLEALIQPAYFIYRSKKLSAILADFKYKRLHIAVVTDDYGGTLGIVTMEDLLEQLVGDIWDEDEEIEDKFKKLDDNKYEISGDMNISDMLELFKKDARYIETESKSVGGWVIEQLGDIPEKGTEFTYRELSVKVNDVEDNRIDTVSVLYTPAEDEEE